MNMTLSLLLPIALGNPHWAPPAMPTTTPLPGASSCATCEHGPTIRQPQFGPFQRPNPLGPKVSCPPDMPAAPVLTTKLIAPNGVTISLPDGEAPKQFGNTLTAGFRPGYVFRFELDNLPNHPNEKLYPVLEIHGSLAPRAKMDPQDYPAPVIISQSDIDRAFAGVMVTKIIYLEDPEQAVPAQSNPDDPLEIAHDLEEDAFISALENGRIVAVLRFGDRRLSEKEFLQSGVANTVLFPGQEYLPAPKSSPTLPWHPVPIHDPILGPKASKEECFVDGGDKGPRLGIGPGGRIGGLDPTDVAVEYSQGDARRVATSNEVCICVPRFIVRRVDKGLARLQARSGLDAYGQIVRRAGLDNKTPVQAVANRVRPLGFDARIRPAMQVGEYRIDSHSTLTELAALGTVEGVMVAGSVVEVDEITSFPNQLVVTKEVDPQGNLKVGDEVTFTIRYRNGTRQPVTDIVVSDSLSGRLEFIPGSASSDRPANVTTRDNEVGSVIVRFELPGSLPPGQEGVVKFRARIR